MFGITPNIHMYQIPETVSHPWNQENPNEVWVQPNQVWVNPVESNGDAWDSQKQDVIEVSEEELNKPSEKIKFLFMTLIYLNNHPKMINLSNHKLRNQMNQLSNLLLSSLL